MTIQLSSRSLPAWQYEFILKLRVSTDACGYVVHIPRLDEKKYSQIKHLLQGLKIYWNGISHRSPDNPNERIQAIVESGKAIKINPFSLHETTGAMIDDLFLIAGFPDPCDYPFQILEPSAGKGAIARRLRSRYPNATIHCYEIDPINQEILKAQGFEVMGSDFMAEANVKNRYDIIAMNPPFNGLEYVRHIKRAHTLLKSYGHLGAIVPETFKMETNKNELLRLQTLVAKCGYVEANEHQFQTTQTNTIILGLAAWYRTNSDAYDAPYEGYPSKGCHDICRVLFSDSIFYEFMPFAENYREARILVERTLLRLRKDELTFLPILDPYLMQATRETIEKGDELRKQKKEREAKTRVSAVL